MWMYYRSLLTPQASFATGVPLVRMNACVVLEIVAAWLFDHAVHKELGQLWPVTPQLAWLSALIRECRKDFREALRKMRRACGHRVFGPQCRGHYRQCCEAEKLLERFVCLFTLMHHSLMHHMSRWHVLNSLLTFFPLAWLIRPFLFPFDTHASFAYMACLQVVKRWYVACLCLRSRLLARS